ncbi:MAG: hypothetical protein K8I60_00945 [Anaerolineae bacterium]|nr:hypothetical protein [Anaerolineae bacterium]
MDDVMIQRAFWQQRLASIAALIGTLAAWFTLATRASMDSELLVEYRVSPDVVQAAYLALSLVLIVILRFEPGIRAWLRSHRTARILVPLAGVISAGAVLLSGADQTARLFRYPLSLWVIIIHIIGLCLLVVLLVLEKPRAEVDNRLERTATWALILMGVVIVLMYVASVGEFMPLDLPDEPWSASMATNFAANGDLSPSYMASAYGSPDPILGRFFLAMGVWIKLIGNSTLTTLRSFPLFVGGIALLVVAAVLWRNPKLTRTQRLAGVITVLGLSSFIRSSHNLRADIGLALSGAFMLWGMVGFFEAQTARWRWLILSVLGFFIGLECIPTIAIPAGLALGLVLVLWFLRQPEKRTNWQPVVIYAGACAVTLAGYFLLQFLPDIPTALATYRSFTGFYSDLTSLGHLRFPFETLLKYNLGFSLILSPVEVGMVISAFVLLWRTGQSTHRRVVMVVTITSILIFVLFRLAFHYWVVLAPFIGYAVAHVLNNRIRTILGVFVLIPALLAAPINDMAVSIQQKSNGQAVAETLPLLDTFPPGSIIVGEPLFWFALHSERTFIGWTGVSHLVRLNQQSQETTLEALNVDGAICWSGYTDRCNAVAGYAMFTSREDFVVDGETYWIFRRGDKPENSG